MRKKQCLRLLRVMYLTLFCFAMDLGLYILKKTKRILIFPGG
ncbi:MAG: hypothetical protein ACYDFR_02910 [Candidatus Omnitrophota bacterium]